MRTGNRGGLLRKESLLRGVLWRSRMMNGELEVVEIERFGGEGGGGRLFQAYQKE